MNDFEVGEIYEQVSPAVLSLVLDSGDRATVTGDPYYTAMPGIQHQGTIVLCVGHRYGFLLGGKRRNLNTLIVNGDKLMYMETEWCGHFVKIS